MKRRKNGEVLAHIAGPSGAGKTELMNRLAQDIDNVELIDLDQYNDETERILGWEHIHKNDYTDAMLEHYHRIRQELIDADIRRINKPIVFFGHHVEADIVTDLPTKRRILLDVSPAKSAWRVGKRPGKGFDDVRREYKIAKEDREYLTTHGYKAESPAEVFNEVKELAKKAKGNPTAIEPYLHGVGLVNGLFEMHEKMSKHGLLGKKRKRNSGELPETITDAHRDAQYLLSEAEDLLSIVTRMYERGEASAEQLAEANEAVMNLRGLEERTRRAVLELPHYRYDSREDYRYDSSEENPRDFEKLNKLSKQMDNLIDEGIMAIYRGDQDKKREILSKQARLQKQIDRERKKNPAYTIHVESPAVRESVEVHAITQGGAFRKGKARLKAKVKSHPKWSVERNSSRPLYQFICEAVDENMGDYHESIIEAFDEDSARRDFMHNLRLSYPTVRFRFVSAYKASEIPTREIESNPLRHGARYAGSNIADEISSPYRSFEDLEIGEAFQFPGYDNETFEKIDDNHARTLSLEPSSGYAARHQMRVDSSDTVFSLGIKVNPLHHGARYAGSNIAEMHKSSRYEKMKYEKGKEAADRMAVAAGLRAAGVSRNGAFTDSIVNGAGFAIGSGAVTALGVGAYLASKEKSLRRAAGVSRNPNDEEYPFDYDELSYESSPHEIREAREAYRRLSCKGKQDCDAFFGNIEELKPCGFHHSGECNPDGVSFYVEENPSRKRKGLPVATLLNPSKRTVKLQSMLKRWEEAALKALNEGKWEIYKVYNEKAARVKKALEHDTERIYKQIHARNGKGIEKNMSAAIKSKLDKHSDMFHGEKNVHKGKSSTHYVSDHVKARNFFRLGSLIALKPKLWRNGLEGHDAPDHWCEVCAIEFNPNTSFLGATTGKKIQPLGSGAKAVGKKLRNQYEREHPEWKGKPIDLRECDVVVYETPEKHSDLDNPPLVDYFHETQEESRIEEHKPHVVLDEEGMPFFTNQHWDVREEGIID